MVAVAPLDPSADRKRAWIAQELAKLSPEEREHYDNDEVFRSCVDLTLEEEWESPGCFERVAAARAMYGDDEDRERADLAAGRHPFHTPR